MIRTTLGIEGMACSMCEAHVNDAVRRNFDVKKVKASHRKRTCVIESANPLDEARLREVIAATGYTLTSIEAG